MNDESYLSVIFSSTSLNKFKKAVYMLVVVANGGLRDTGTEGVTIVQPG